MENRIAKHLSLDSTLQELSLYDFQLESSYLGKEVAQIFQKNSLLPGVILTEQNHFVGMLSRRRFLEHMSRPYGLELFLQRPLYSLYRFAGTEVLRIKGKVKIVEAAHISLQRTTDAIYEPIVVEMEDGSNRLLDIYQLLLAQSKIHQLTTQLLEKANRELERLANCDSLTGVANRYRFDEYLNSYWQQHFGSTSLLSLIMCDVDYFKAYNDTYGHQAGDECLQKVAAAIQDTVKQPTDLVARYGGEEFAVILPFTSISEAINLAEKIRHSVKALRIPHEKSTPHCGVTISIGVASILPTPQVLPTRLIAAADTALYQAKSSGRDGVACALPNRMSVIFPQSPYCTSAFD